MTGFHWRTIGANAGCANDGPPCPGWTDRKIFFGHSTRALVARHSNEGQRILNPRCCRKTLLHRAISNRVARLLRSQTLQNVSSVTTPRLTLSANMLANHTEIHAESSPVARGKARLLTLDAMDGRTIAARRARELARGFVAELGGSLTVSRRLAVERAAALTAIAEDCQARRLKGDTNISLEDLVRATNAATRAVKALNIKPPAPASPPSLRAYMASRAATASPERQSPREGAEGHVGEKAQHAPQEKQGEAFEEDRSW
jgi:hypothetical protein